MKSMELKASLMQDVEALLDNEETKEKLIRYVRRLKAKVRREQQAASEDDPKPCTMEELEAELDESEADFVAGRAYSSEQVFREIREKYGWKCK